jgi:hypothetical protein
MAIGIFLSYRRDDTSGYAGRLYDRLKQRFPGRVFMDVGEIDPGSDFAASIEQAVSDCTVLIALIGKRWLSDGRLQDPSDFVRLEIGTAVKRGVHVIPVLVGDATLPDAASLPPDLRPLLGRQAVAIRDADWDAACERLMAAIEKDIGAGRASSTTFRRLLIGTGIALAAGICIIVALRLKTPDQPRREQHYEDKTAQLAEPPRKYACAVAYSYGQAASALDDVGRQIAGEAPPASKPLNLEGRWRMRLHGKSDSILLDLRADHIAGIQFAGKAPGWGCWNYAALQNLLTLDFGKGDPGTMELRIRQANASSFAAAGTDGKNYDAAKQ